MKSHCRYLLMLGLLVCSLGVSAYQPNLDAVIPDELQPWKEWVLSDQSTYGCPFNAKQFQQKHCHWPALLKLDANDQRMQFELYARVYQAGWLQLPGGDGFWPMDVTVNANPKAAVDAHGRPALFLDPGEYQVHGVIRWQQIADSILIPSQTGLVHLVVNGHHVNIPRRDQSGKLWLLEQAVSVEVNEEDKLGVSVYRHLKDQLPFLVDTEIRLEVAGRPREMLLGIAQLPGFELMSVDSQLPARVDEDGRLRIQVRPGSWRLRVQTRAPGMVDQVVLPELDAIWPSEELWSFEPKPALRLVRIEGVESIDPQQTSIPDAWKSWQAYRLIPGQVLKLVTLRRGDPEPAPNRLTLHRQSWLNFNGDGLVFQDQIRGKLSRDWRLNLAAPYELGWVTSQGKSQVVTEFADQRGIELRESNADIKAVSSIDQSLIRKLSLPATGWQHDFDNLSWQLHLPPGWQLLTATDSDSVTNAWLNKWQVWDVFLLLITVASLIKLRGITIGLISAVSFILIYPEEPGILWLWLNLIAVLALLKLLKPSRFQKFIIFYGRLSAVFLVLICIPFLISQARTAIYPQLERGGYSVNYRAPLPMAAPAQEMAVEALGMESDSMVRAKAKVAKLRAYSAAEESLTEQRQLVSIDPNAAAQTGPSIPTWQWQSVMLSWNGPVTKEQQVTLYLLKPLDSRIVALLRVILLVVITVGLFKGWRSSPLKPNGAMLGRIGLTLFLPGTLLTFSQESFALSPPASEVTASSPLTPSLPPSTKLSTTAPDNGLLLQLKARLLNAADCTPNCIAINQARLRVTDKLMIMMLEVNALEAVQIPLPHAKTQWQLMAIEVDDHPATIRFHQGERWIALEKGRQRVVISGVIDISETLELVFPYPVNNLSLAAPNWRVRGMENGRIIGGALYLEPQDTQLKRSEPESGLQPNVIAPFVKVERYLRLGLNWYVETHVSRLAPKMGAIKLQIPLISGESVTTQNVSVENGKVAVSLNPQQQKFVWYSALDKSRQIDLKALESVPWLESWHVESAPLWHLEYEGLDPIKQNGVSGAGGATQWRPTWYPLPGEALKLSIVKPKPAPGVTTTIDRASLSIKPGKAESSYELDLSLRSSKGAEQRIKLQEKARVLSVMVDGRAQPSQENGTHLVIPVNPGEHRISIHWREPTTPGWQQVSPVIEIDGLFSNIETSVEVPRSRWVLWLNGPQLGPAVLVWGELLVVILLAVALSRIPGIPLKTYEWILLAMGLCAGLVEAAVVVVIWFVALAKRQQLGHQLTRTRFNLLQVGLVILTLVAMITMLGVIPMGLMGSPDMGIVGNGSSHYYLNWYQDQAEQWLPTVAWVSVPLWCYRLMMLVWSLWLAVAVLRWLKWAWACFSDGGLWKAKPGTESATRSSEESA
ncbi:MAG: hypothetical protein MI976_08310 [Pseudomonadales bacterium]|nr:hypothetical protein [Pseudomonadales bacterium]